jgi:4-aminobutyrate aminotransferase / (S)-3-amino-2-methylpropionate transaminase / 5-aminovalerate transaminase
MNTDSTINEAMHESASAPPKLDDFLVVNQNIEPYLASGRGAEVCDEQGRNYIDLEAGPGVASVGHCHPRVVQAIKDQADRLLQVPGRYHSVRTLTLAQRISGLAGGGLRRTFFTNSGAESADGAIKCSLKHAANTGKKGFGIIALEHGFHGRLSLPLALTGIAKQKRGMGPYGTFPGVVHAPAPYCYRCPLKLEPDKCGTACADVVEDMLHTRVPGEAAVMIAEPILGVGGVIVPPDAYWPKVQAICKRHRITLVMDEVFVGFGRTGADFAHQHYGLEPDIVTFAKAIGGGVPLGGFICTEELGTAFEPGDHFTTYGAKNQIGIAAGHAVLDILRDEALKDKARETGAQFLAGLKGIQSRFPVIGDVRGRGLMIGFELVRDANRTPAPDIAKALQREMLKRGALISTTGAHGNVLRITPPLVITAEQVERALAIVEASVAALNV